MIRSIAEIPFPRRGPLEVLHLDGDRDGLDEDYAGFGHGRVDELTLEGRDGAVVVRDALVLALHCVEGGGDDPDDIELEFVVDEATGASVSAALSAFLAARLPALLGGERAVVLALCNPRPVAVARPPCLPPGSPLYYGLGDVESWYHDGARLVAEAWRIAR